MKRLQEIQTYIDLSPVVEYDDSEPKPFKIYRDGKPETIANFKIGARRIAKAYKKVSIAALTTFGRDMDRFINDCFIAKENTLN